MRGRIEKLREVAGPICSLSGQRYRTRISELPQFTPIRGETMHPDTPRVSSAIPARLHYRILTAAIRLLLIGFLLPGVSVVSFAQVPAPSGALKVIVIAGEDAVNIIQQKTAVTPIVEIRDRNNLPVAGAVVTFTIQGGTGGAFGGASALTVTTNAAGQAAAAGFSPLTAGAVQINVQAAFQGQVAAATIVQTNVLTAAEAAAAAAGGTGSTSSGAGAGGATGGGGGLSGTAIAGIAAGVAGAGALVAVSGDDTPPNTAPTAALVTASPAVVLLGADPVVFAAQVSDAENDPVTYRWEFGDGNTSAEASPRYSYTAAGTFVVRLSVSDGQATTTASTTVDVRTLTGTWRSDTIASNFGPVQVTMFLTQNGTSVSGTVPVITGPTGSAGPGTLSGTVRSTSPRITMAWVLTNDGIQGRTTNHTVTLDPAADLNSLSGNFGGPQGTFRRQ